MTNPTTRQRAKANKKGEQVIKEKPEEPPVKTKATGNNKANKESEKDNVTTLPEKKPAETTKSTEKKTVPTNGPKSKAK